MCKEHANEEPRKLLVGEMASSVKERYHIKTRLKEVIECGSGNC